MTTIVWFRNDLRIDDNPALAEAIKHSRPILPLFIWSPEEEGKWPLGGASRWWLHHSLQALEKELEEIGLRLVIQSGPSLKILLKLIQQTQAKNILWNRRYEPYIIKRDSSIKLALAEAGVEVQSFNGSLLFEPWSISNKQGKPFQVFTPFWRKCLQQPIPLPITFPRNQIKGTPTIDSIPLPSLELLPKIHWDAGLEKQWKPGEKEAKKLLKSFLSNHVGEYAEMRDRPDVVGTSLMSPYLHFGEISPRTIWHSATSEDMPYLRQICWREFAYHLLYHFPATPAKPLKPAFETFPWKCNTNYLQAWQKGLTGYPIVDAGMRELWTIGWMHNRVRMIVGSFLVKDLLIPWQEGAKWFWDTLVDADLANNTLGWQWVAGCGADASPFFRIFNPITQGEKFDPDGTYICKWIPELAKLPKKWIHRPWEAPSEVLHSARVTLGVTYPYPIVDHAEARNQALAAFKEMKER